MEFFMIRGWGLILPGCGGTGRLPRGVTPAARRAFTIGRGQAGGGQWDWGSESAAFNVNPYYVIISHVLALRLPRLFFSTQAALAPNKLKHEKT